MHPEDLWNRISKSYGYGDVIITLGTGRLSKREEEGMGLAGEHDYAVLDLKEVNAQRHFLVKNPWCNGTAWNGLTAIVKKRPDGIESTPKDADAEDVELMPRSDMALGKFWINFDEVVQNFESLYLNWNPGLFRYRQDHHFSWVIQPVPSATSFAHNPQYSIKSANESLVWLLLSRHFSTEEHRIPNKSNNGEPKFSSHGFISLYIFNTNGRRIHLSSNVLLRGPFVDSPQTLARFTVPPMTAYTVVVAQQDLPLPKYSFTLSAFSRERIEVGHAWNPFPHVKIISGAWTARTAGGNANSPAYPSNPQFSISLKSSTDINLLLETCHLELPIHVMMVWSSGERVTAVSSKDIFGESGAYQRGCALAEMSSVPAGIYTVICSTFERGQTGDFTLRVESISPCEVRPIAGEDAGRHSLPLPVLLLGAGVNRMLAPVVASHITRLRIIARYGKVRGSPIARSPLKITLEQGQGPHKTVLTSSCNGEFSDGTTDVRTEDININPQMGRREGVWLVVERLGGITATDQVEVEILSEASIKVGPWGTGNG